MTEFVVVVVVTWQRRRRRGTKGSPGREISPSLGLGRAAMTLNHFALNMGSAAVASTVVAAVSSSLLDAIVIPHSTSTTIVHKKKKTMQSLLRNKGNLSGFHGGKVAAAGENGWRRQLAHSLASGAINPDSTKQSPRQRRTRRRHGANPELTSLSFAVCSSFSLDVSLLFL